MVYEFTRPVIIRAPTSGIRGCCNPLIPHHLIFPGFSVLFFQEINSARYRFTSHFEQKQGSNMEVAVVILAEFQTPTSNALSDKFPSRSARRSHADHPAEPHPFNNNKSSAISFIPDFHFTKKMKSPYTKKTFAQGTPRWRPGLLPILWFGV